MANSGVEASRVRFFGISGLWEVDCLPQSDERGDLQWSWALIL